MTVSSIKTGNDPYHLLDNNRLTEFAFDEKVDGAGAALITVDFGKNVDLHRLKFWTSTGAKIKGMQIRLGTDLNRLKTVKSESAFTKLVDGHFPFARYVEISLWGPSVKVQDILFYTRPVTEVYFTAEPGMSYRLLTGNPQVKFYQFESRKEIPLETAVKATLSPLKLNRLLAEDIDGDTIENKEDNCPFVANKAQKDTDEDGFGNDCDNAPKRKNYDQSDVDRDGIADIIDNCKINANPGQYDEDKDGIGDQCDTANNSGAQLEAKIETISNTATSPLLLGGVLLAILAAAGVWYWRKKKQ